MEKFVIATIVVLLGFCHLWRILMVPKSIFVNIVANKR
jgi:hypothetical protein